jgi:outer membrane lipoprotein-sorting protein
MHTRICTGLTAAAVGALLVAAAPAPAQTPKEIIEKVDRLLRGDSSRGVATMTVATEHWERTLSMEVWSLGTDHSLVRVTAPPKEAGTATLKADKDIWNYLPKVDRAIKIPASMMMGAWMGSHFTNDDLVKESQLVEDYDIEVLFEGEREGDAVWEFRLTPKPEAPVVWGFIDYQVRKRDTMPMWARYYDEDGNLARTMTFDDFRTMDGRLVPARMKMVPEDKPAESTAFVYDELEFDVDLKPSFFSLQSLKRRR